MRVSISNIAWDPEEDEAVATLLRAKDIDAIDIAHSKYFPDPATATVRQILDVRERWMSSGFEIVGMQALLFGTQGLNIFGDVAVRAAMLQHLQQVARIGGTLGAKYLVFGSPKNRDRSGLGDQEADDMAADFFRQLGAIGEAEGVCFCLEPNPLAYGCNFMSMTDDTARVVAMVAHPAIRLQLDSGAMAMNDECAGDMVAAHFELAGHVHVSEPQLMTIGDGTTDHEGFATALQEWMPRKIATIEMLAAKTEPHLDAIGRACDLVISRYRGARNAAQ